MSELTEILKEKANDEYAAFTKKLVPDTAYPILGIKLPDIKEIAKRVSPSVAEDFFNERHVYYEEYMLHGLMICGIKNGKVLDVLNDFLPFIDNWAICDSVSASIKKLSKNKDELLTYIKKWLSSDKPYTLRFAIVTLMNYYINDEYLSIANELVLSVKSEHYYVNMAIAWYLSVALVKYYDDTVKIIEKKTLPKFIQNKTISKARESFRISDDKKAYLKTLKIK